MIQLSSITTDISYEYRIIFDYKKTKGENLNEYMRIPPEKAMI